MQSVECLKSSAESSNSTVTQHSPKSDPSDPAAARTGAGVRDNCGKFACDFSGALPRLRITALEAHTSKTGQPLWMPSRNRIVTCGYDGTVRTWSMCPRGGVPSQDQVLVFQSSEPDRGLYPSTPAPLSTVLAMPSGRLLLSYAGATINVWSLAGNIECRDAVELLCWSPTGGLLFTGGPRCASARVWRLQEQQRLGDEAAAAPSSPAELQRAWSPVHNLGLDAAPVTAAAWSGIVCE
ncbi:uncharacterized protein LOC125179422 [Hyalella azteca]|uniref:Uncharacterized protein LOC125179422 n=1 Tax=Hyalella azteca TaxID=294128 RepID=A0A979FVC6_HYAAZ|nr:uncharacterized protein LOC125179422 [Hyalella azteca]